MMKTNLVGRGFKNKLFDKATNSPTCSRQTLQKNNYVQQLHLSNGNCMESLPHSCKKPYLCRRL